MMLEEFTSPLVADLKSGNNVVQMGDVTVKLAQDFGFCWGVERAVAMSFQVTCCLTVVCILLLKEAVLHLAVSNCTLSVVRQTTTEVAAVISVQLKANASK
jgi:hypothetical protein